MMPPNSTPKLSKSRFTGGLQCLKRLYLECYDRKLADPIGTSQQALFDSGTAVGELARQRFPGGVLIEEDHLEHDKAVTTTAGLVSDPDVPALYEAAFTHEGIRIRADILIRGSEGSFDLVEVKSTTRVKQEHIPDAAIQLHVLQGAGINVRRVSMMHIDNRYVYQGGQYDLHGLFSLTDITDEATEYLAATVPGSLIEMWHVLQGSEPPAIETGTHCTKPYQCPFYGHCHQDEPVHSVQQLPSVSAKLLQSFKDQGIRDIRDIPSGFSGLSATQQRVRESVATGEPFVSSGIAEVITQVDYPMHFLDFETFNPALPAYAGIRPYQMVAFQWSLHTLDHSGQLRHDYFLAEDGGDPRGAFASSLLEALGNSGTVVVYSSFEATRLKELASLFPHHAQWLSAVIERMADLLALLRKHYYHPEFHGSYSLKSVLPALVPDLGYGDLEIQGGSEASVAFETLLTAHGGEEERRRLRSALLAYCKRDTEAMVRLYEKLRITVKS